MMLKKLLIILIVLVGCAISLVAWKWDNLGQVTNIPAKDIPAFSFLRTDSSFFSNNDINASKPITIIAYFHPDCDHCQNMAIALVANKRKLVEVNIVMVSFATQSEIQAFYNKYNLNDMSGLVVLQDKDMQFEKLFGKCNVPAFFVYKEKRLIKKIAGEVGINTLLDGI